MTGAVIGGLATLASGCAQDPPVAAGAPDNCILVCALVRVLTGESDPVPVAPPPAHGKAKPKPKPKPKPAAEAVAVAKKPTATHVRPHRHRHVAVSPRETLSPDDVRPRVNEAPVEGSTVPRAPDPEPTITPPDLPSQWSQLPGSAPIDQVTSRFAPHTPDGQ